MKFVVSSSLLSARLQTIGRVVVPKSSLSILEYILFKVEGNLLTLTAADSETMLTTTMELVEAEENVEFVVHAKIIQDAIKEIPEQPVDFYVNPETFAITIEYLNGQYNVVAQSAEQYPLPQNLQETCSQISIDSQLLYAGINRVMFAVSNDTLRPQMTGVCFDLQEEALTLVATDAQKMSCTTFPGLKGDATGSFILPKKPAMLLRNFLIKEEGETNITFASKNAIFKTESYTMICRLVEGIYPNYKGVISLKNDIHVTVNRAALMSTLRRILIFSNSASLSVKLKFSNNRLTITSHELDFSKSAEESLLCDYQHTPLSIGFHGAHLLEIVSNIDSEEIVMQLAGPSRAGLFVPSTTSEQEDVVMLLMPLMIND